MFKGLRKFGKLVGRIIYAFRFVFGKHNLDTDKAIKKTYELVTKDLKLTHDISICIGTLEDTRYKAVAIFKHFMFGMVIPPYANIERVVLGCEPEESFCTIIITPEIIRKAQRTFFGMHWLVQSLAHELYHVYQNNFGLMVTSTYGMSVRKHNSLQIEKDADKYGNEISSKYLRDIILSSKKED